MNIGEAAKRSKLTAKTIRYYEDIELIKPARADNGYRDYSDLDIHQLCFVQRARHLGFSIDECRQLLALYKNKRRTNKDVKRLVKEKLLEIDQKLEELQSLRNTLNDLATQCSGDNRPECPILDDLSGEISTVKTS